MTLILLTHVARHVMPSQTDNPNILRLANGLILVRLVRNRKTTWIPTKVRFDETKNQIHSDESTE